MALFAVNSFTTMPSASDVPKKKRAVLTLAAKAARKLRSVKLAKSLEEVVNNYHGSANKLAREHGR